LQALAVRKHAKDFLPSFIGALNDSSDLVAAYGADGLRIAARKSTGPILERHLPNASAHTRASILGALHALGQPKALRNLLDMLRSSDYRVICFVANLLTELKLTNRERRLCVRALDSVLTSVRGRAPRDAVARALAHFEPRR
jgi:HEAT repeat protein